MAPAPGPPEQAAFVEPVVNIDDFDAGIRRFFQSRNQTL
jgi:hypothetical protein